MRRALFALPLAALAGFALANDERTRGQAAGLPPAFAAAGLSAPGTADPPGNVARITVNARTAPPDARDPVSAVANTAVMQDFPYYPYNGRWTFARIYTAGGGRRWGRRMGPIGSAYGPGWSHDWPSAERNFSKILNELTYTYTTLEEYGGNILKFEDPRLTQFPLAYISEPGEWEVTDEEIRGLRAYIQKGGFLVFDDFSGYDMFNLAEQMKRVMPELDWIRLDGSEPVFDSFFTIELGSLRINNAGFIEFYGLFVENDKTKRMIAIAGNNGDLGEFWEYSDTGWAPIDLSNEAYKLGINFVIYAMTH